MMEKNKFYKSNLSNIPFQYIYQCDSLDVKYHFNIHVHTKNHRLYNIYNMYTKSEMIQVHKGHMAMSHDHSQTSHDETVQQYVGDIKPV